MRLPAAVERFLMPSVGTCYRCNRPWKVPAVKYEGYRDGIHHSLQLNRLMWWGLIGVQEHMTDYGEEGSGCFPLCEGCWSILTPSQRWPYYEALIERWKRDIDVPREKVLAINDAVCAGR